MLSEHRQQFHYTNRMNSLLFQEAIALSFFLIFFRGRVMQDNTTILASLHIEDAENALLDVIEFKGTDALSTPYEFHVLCASSDPGLASKGMIQRQATLRLSWAEWTNAYSGVLFSFKKMQTVETLTFYKATLVPRIKLLDLTQHNQIFLNKTLPQILEVVFEECNLKHYEFRLAAEYENMEYVCQYNETHFNFISRWMEHFGLYYFFEESEAGERLVITDSRIVHVPLGDGVFPYRQPSGMDDHEKLKSIFSFSHEEHIVPQRVMLKDYNPLHPDMELLAEAEVDPNGIGKTYHYGDHFQTLDQGQALARVRAEELLSGKTVCHGRSGCLPLRAGGLFTLSRHPDSSFNTAYLLVSVAHEGKPASPMTAGVEEVANLHGELGYRNQFEGRPGSRQFRPRQTATKTQISGVLNGKVDAETGDDYPELDSMGRYRVRLPFDLAGRPPGRASSWLRMAQPYAGNSYGMHFPLHKGTEVFIGFENADPDRPYISGAVHNGETQNFIKDSNSRLSGIKSSANNQLMFNETKGQECATLWSPYHNSGFAVGSVKEGGGGSLLQWTTGDNDCWVLGSSVEGVVGSYTQAVAGATNYIYAGSTSNIIGPFTVNLNFGQGFTYTKGSFVEFGDSTLDMSSTITHSAPTSVTISAGVPVEAEGILQSAKKAMYLMATAVAFASVGSIAATECFSTNGAWSQDGPASFLGGVAGGTSMYLGAGLAVEAANITNKICKDFNKAMSQTQAGSVVVNSSGVTATARNVPPSMDRKITLEVGTASIESVVSPKSSVVMNSTGVNISTSAVASMVIDGVNVDHPLQIKELTGDNTLSMGPTGITLDAGDSDLGISFSMNAVERKISASVSEGPSATFNEEAISLESTDKQSSVKVSNTSLTLKSPSVSVGGAIKVNEAGFVTIG
ncbi:type VI secretion system Vgr family protein [Desulfovibrio inopinatus]|uniref:type VI secretion system Vgr family protein n=1 Tax=Desulfovibrio inopinatus TaxID=102109 RepID=UPI00146FC431|nr:type VI secretion system tip protein TssI/VgrG [Desulfovibrio inopinatus]